MKTLGVTQMSKKEAECASILGSGEGAEEMPLSKAHFR